MSHRTGKLRIFAFSTTAVRPPPRDGRFGTVALAAGMRYHRGLREMASQGAALAEKLWDDVKAKHPWAIVAEWRFGKVSKP